MHQIRVIKSITNGASKALILFHGRGGSAEDILSLATSLNVKGFSLYAPQANSHTWYPNSFLAAPELNAGGLVPALEMISHTVSEIQKDGIPKEAIYFLGFSQGACLAVEYVTRNASKYGGVIIFTGGLIGDKIYMENYHGNFEGTPIFVGSSNPDFHVPIERVYATSNILREMGAVVTEKIYNNMGHTINQDEIDTVNSLFFNNQ